MGWTEYRATHFYLNGAVNRKAECDGYFMEGLNKGWYEVVKSTMVGSVYYAAIRALKEYTKDSDGNPVAENIPKEKQIVYGVVFLTSVRTKNWFAYKPMTETMGPNQCKCPKSIIDILSPTNDKGALEWRQKCLDNAQKPNLGRLPIGTRIQLPPHDGKTTILVKCPPRYQFKTPFWMVEGECKYYSKKRIRDFEVL